MTDLKHSRINWLFWFSLAIPVIAFVAECLYGTETVDGNVFRYIGANMATGGRLYETAWDNKGPVLFLPQFIGYVLFPNGTWGPGFVLMLMWIGIGAFFHKLLTKLIGDNALTTIALFIMTLMATGMDGLANQNAQEPIALFFVLAGLTAHFCLRPRIGAMILGCCVAAVFLIKPNLVSFGAACIAIWLHELHQTKNWRSFWTSVSFSFAGFAGTLLIVTSYFALTGRAFALWDATLLFGLFEYGNRDASILSFWQKWFANRLRDPLGGNHNLWQLPIFLCLFVTSLIGIKRLLNNKKAGLAIFFLTWLVGEYAMTLCMRQFFEHYLVMLCPICVTLSIYALWPTMRRHRITTVAILALITLWYGVFDIGMIHAVRRNNLQDNWRLRLRQWADAEQVSRLITLGSLPAAGILDHLKIQSDQKYFAVIMNYGFAKADWRKREMEDDLLHALRDERSKWLFSEKSLEDVATTFSARPEISRELRRWAKSFEIPSGAIYKRTNTLTP